MIEVVVTTGAIRCAKLQPPTNQHLAFYRPDAIPITQQTVSSLKELHQTLMYKLACEMLSQIMRREH